LENLNAYIVGGPTTQFVDSFVHRLNNCLSTLHIKKVGGVTAEGNPKKLSVSDDTNLVLVIKDIVSHKLRDHIVTLAKEKSVQVVEIPSKISHAVMGLRLCLGEQIPFVNGGVPTETLLDTKEERAKYIAETIPLWDLFPYHHQHSASTKALQKFWKKTIKKADRENADMSYETLEYIYKATKSLDSDTKIKKVSLWLESAIEEDFVFKSTNNLKRALKMVFGQVDYTKLDSELIDLAVNGYPKIEIDFPKIEIQSNPIRTEPINLFESVDELVSKVIHSVVQSTPEPVIEEPVIEEPVIEEPVIEEITPATCLIVSGVDLTHIVAQGGSLHLESQPSEALTVKGFDMSVESIKNGVLYGLRISSKG
jgi:hypothetical protein